MSYADAVIIQTTPVFTPHLSVFSADPESLAIPGPCKLTWSVTVVDRVILTLVGASGSTRRYFGQPANGTLTVDLDETTTATISTQDEGQIGASLLVSMPAAPVYIPSVAAYSDAVGEVGGPRFPGLGTDIELDPDGNFVIAASGDIALVEDIDCLKQGVIHRLITPLGGLFYDEEYGFDHTQYLHRDADEFTQGDFCQKVKEQLQLEPRILQGSISCEALSCENDIMRFKVSFAPIEGTTPVNLVLGANLTDMWLVA